MKNILSTSCLIVVFTCCSLFLSAQNQGKIVFVGFNADGSDGFAVLTLADIPSGFVLYFTDNNWDGTSFTSNEGEIEWENTTGSTIQEGTIITFNPTTSGPMVDVGTINSGTLSLNADNESIFALGVPSASVDGSEDFISAIGTELDNSGATDLTNTGLTNGVDAIVIDGDEDVMVYDGANGTDCTGLTFTQCATLFNTSGSWITQDGSGSQHNDMVSPDFPDDVIGSATIPSSYGVLPIDLLRFYGNLENGAIQLNWETAAEINNEYFVIEHSQDGNTFEEIGRLDGAGDSYETLHYTFLHQNPSKGMNYYRLQQLNYDKTYMYSSVVLMENIRAGRIPLGPNPFRDHLEISFEDFNYLDGIIEIYDFRGKIQMRQNIEAGITTQVLQVASLPKGIYHVRLTFGSDIQIARVVKL